jgi:hypothetical protein
MIDSYEIIKTIEKIYKKTGLVECVKGQKSKHKLILLVLPIIVFVLLFCTLLFLSFCDKYPLIRVFLTVCFAISIFCILRNHKKFLMIQYGIKDNNDENFYYNLFKKDILENKFSREILIKVKNILEIETREEQNPLNKYFIGYCSLILIPTLFIIFENPIKENIYFLCVIISIAIFFPIFMYLIDFFLNAKHHNKKAILKNIERILIEIED